MYVWRVLRYGEKHKIKMSCILLRRAKPVYIGGQLVYSVGMVFMALTQSKWGVLLFSWAAGVMYSTLFTMPYLLVAHYHECDETVKSPQSPFLLSNHLQYQFIV